MQGSKKFTLDDKEVIKRWLEFQGKKRAFIGDNWVRQAVLTHYNVYYNLSKPKYIDTDLDWFVIDHLCELIDDD